jgi:hypothetical protein
VHTSELKLTSPSEVLEAIKRLRAGKDPSPNGVPNRAPKHQPIRAITFLKKVFNAVLRWQYFPPAWKHARVVSILMPGKDPTVPCSYRPVLFNRWYARILNYLFHNSIVNMLIALLKSF